MEKTRSDIISTLEDNLSDLFNEVVTQVKEAVALDDSGAEEYADEQGYEDSDEPWGTADEPPSPADLRNLIIAAYNTGRDAATAALEEAIDEALG